MTYMISKSKDTELYKAEEALRSSFQNFQMSPHAVNLSQLLQEAFTLKNAIPGYHVIKHDYLETHQPDPLSILEQWENQSAHLSNYTCHTDHLDLIAYRSESNDLVIAEHDVTVAISSLLVLLRWIS